jgi:polar amino acid transport system ATP-binding protein
MTDPIIEFNAVSKSFSGHRVLDDVSFRIAPGEKIALIGPSGSGKTTILRILMTLESLDQGEVRILGESVFSETRKGKTVRATEQHLRKMRSHVGMVFQQFNLFPHKTVLENVALAPELTGKMSATEARHEALQLLDMVGLADKADRMPAFLSGGQKQRVGLARALALRPRILLLDEVTSALDPELVDEVLEVIRRIGRETDMTMLLVTHEMSFAHRFVDRVLFFDAGHIVEEGPPDKIFTAPECERTRIFLKKIIAAGHQV